MCDVPPPCMNARQCQAYWGGGGYLAACGLHAVNAVGEVVCEGDGAVLHQVEEGRPAWDTERGEGLDLRYR